MAENRNTLIDPGASGIVLNIVDSSYVLTRAYYVASVFYYVKGRRGGSQQAKAFTRATFNIDDKFHYYTITSVMNARRPSPRGSTL